MRRRWKTVIRTKRYTNATDAEVASLSPMLLAMDYTLVDGQTESLHFTRWGAALKANNLNTKVGPSVMWRAVVERAT